MSSEVERYQRIHSILTGARNLDGEPLQAYLASACGGDTNLKEQVLRLLVAGRDDASSDAFAESRIASARAALEGLANESTAAWLPERIGNYVIVRQIGQGGMGIVYEAIQESPRRSVAIKLLHPIHATENRLRRFRNEAELLGRLRHPGIAQIHEAGTYDIGRGPQPFIAMELVAGVDLRTHSDLRRLSLRERIELIAQVADAIQYAHEHGVVHRDIKPGNVLVNEFGHVRILDFGIARATDSTTPLSTLLTDTGQMCGTLAYMAPEQLARSPDRMTALVDVYALGVLAFELLLGRLPHLIADLPLSRAVALLTSTDAPRARDLDASLRGDVDTILGKALEPDPARRYASAGAFASDLRRYLADQPIEARPPSRAYRIAKFVRRHTALVVGVTTTLAVAITGALVATNYAIEAGRSEDRATLLAQEATRRADELERASYLSGIAAAHSAVLQQNFGTAASFLDRTPQLHRGWEYAYLRAQLVHFSEEWEAPRELVTAPTFDVEGKRMFAMMADGSIGTWDTSNGRLLRVFSVPGIVEHPIESGGTTLLHGPSLRFAACTPDGDIVLGDLASGAHTRVGVSHTEPQIRLHAFDGTGRRLLYGASATYILEGSEAQVLTPEQSSSGAFSRDGKRVALATAGRVALFDIATSSRIAACTLDDVVMDLEFAPDDGTLAIAGYYRNVFLLDAHTLEINARLTGHRDVVYDVTWNAAGTRVISCSEDGTLRSWNVQSPADTVRRELGFRGVVRATTTSDSANILVAGAGLRRFPLEDPTVLRGHESYVYALTFSADGSMLASAGHQFSGIHVWNVNLGNMTRRFPAPAHGFAEAPRVSFSADGKRLVACKLGETLHWDVASGEALACSPNQDPIESFFETLGRRVWGEQGGSFLSWDGQRLAVCSGDEVTLHDLPEPLQPGGADLRGRFPEPQLPPNATLLGRLVGHSGLVYCVAFSPDGTRIASGGSDATVRLWDANTLELLLVLRGHGQYVMGVAFSPDGTMLASASGDTTIRLWDTKPLSERRAMK